MNTPFFLHAGHAFAWDAWHPEPTLVTAVVLSIVLYILQLRSGWNGSHSERPGFLRVIAFFAGIALVFVALGSPLDAGAGELFSLHMLQHTVLSMWAPPLLLMGLTRSILAPLLANRTAFTVLRAAVHPVVGAAAFVVNMWFWHVPPIYQLALTEQSVHYVMHLSFLGTGLMFWWTIASPIRDLHPLSTGWRMLHIFATNIPMMVLAFVMATTPSVLYDYYNRPDLLWGLTPGDDQQLAGTVMGSLGEITLAIPFGFLFVRLLSDEPEPEGGVLSSPDAPTESP